MEDQSIQEDRKKQLRAAGTEERPGERPEAEARRAGQHLEPIWDIHEAARYLKLPISSVYKMTARKAAVRIPHIRIGNKLRFRQSDIDRWLTLLTVSNLKLLTKIHQKVQQVTHGRHSQTEATER